MSNPESKDQNPDAAAAPETANTSDQIREGEQSAQAAGAEVVDSNPGSAAMVQSQEKNVESNPAPEAAPAVEEKATEEPVEEKTPPAESLPPVEEKFTEDKPCQDGGLPLYRCHKEVRALKIRELNPPHTTGFRKPNGSLTMVPWETGFEPIVLSPEYVTRHKPEVGGFYVVYADGYVSYSPQKAFEDGYTLLT